MFQQGGWSEECLVDEPGYDTGETQPNHDALAAFLCEHFSREPFVELYGLWDGDWELPVEDRREIAVTAITSPQFHFRERGFCRVAIHGTISKTEPSTRR